MTNTAPLNYHQLIPDVLQKLAHVHDTLDTHGLERRLHHLVLLRASQINACAHCVEMHTREAREDGESNKRLDHLVVWRQVAHFSERERAAFAWTEALTSLDHKQNVGALRAQLRSQFSEQEIAALTATVALINLWNRIGISRH